MNISFCLLARSVSLWHAAPDMSEEENAEVKHLQAVLEQETKTRQQQEVYNSKLQEEYDVLLKKLAAAELHIDRLRVRANVHINKRFVVSHDSIQSSLLQQGVAASYSPTESSWRGDSVEKVAYNTFQGEGVDYWRPEGVNVGFPHNDEEQQHGIMTEGAGTLPGIQHYSSLSSTRVPQDVEHLSSQQQHSFDEPELQPELSAGEQQQPQQQPHNTSHHLSESGASQNTSLNLSQVSTGYIKRQASAESQHLAQMFCIRSLQEQIAALKGKLCKGNTSFDEMSRDLGQILDEHETLTGNITPLSAATATENQDSVGGVEEDRGSKGIAQRRAALESEVS